MPSDNFWLLEDRVLMSYPHGVVTLDDLTKANEVLIGLLRSAAANGHGQVHLLVDGAEVVSQPSPIAAQRVFTYMKEQNLGWTAIGGSGNPILLFFTRMVSVLVQSRTRLMETPQQALEFLMRKDETLPDLLPLYQRIRDERKPE